ncbi:MAG: hypothetical protein A2452_09595 [Candidatus Firestonebacteria bacterium RIFOXYC2_FULL_39_67]|nr:MAG: hypothetical protein A2536_09725 [Candidatus Firestonebacteria bacterium RIFOXYD2_FULL_39_29]OGF54806.1 MAG: hypothetical protein A2497_07570 [Candidatus Firestonebacteria bacterium RifOxyC12_full_39_7]OGF55257.1 MAG: hypothetical protein A2452_09595 [Candidatus Firestonebacteria bacterium RIFOXYC2_FULL_39_67]
MKIEVLVKPGSSKEKLEKTGDNRYTVWVHEPPIENKANLAVIKQLSKYFDVPKSYISILHGSKGRKKLFTIDE